MKKWIAISVALVALALVYVFGVNGSKWDELTVTLEVLEPATVKFNFTCEGSDVLKPKTGEYPAPEVDPPTRLKIDWGDGQVTDSDSHTYQVAGTYIVKIRGKGIGTFNPELGSDAGITKVIANNWPGLVYLNMYLPEIDFTQCPKVEYVYCYLTDQKSLDFSQCPKLTFLVARGALTGLNVTGCAELAVLECTDCQLTQLDVSTCTKLKVLDCSKNQITQLSLNSALTALQCSDNKLTNLDLQPELLTLYCGDNPMTSLDAGKAPKLTLLDIANGQLTHLDISKNPELTRLSVFSNQLTNLDTSKNHRLAELYCDNNKMKTLDLSGHVRLTRLQCSNNQMTDLDISKCRKLCIIGCSNNQFSHSALNKIYNDLPYADGAIFIFDNPGTGDTPVAVKKGWVINGLNFQRY